MCIYLIFYRSGLDRINNIEIKEEAKQDVAELNQFLTQFNNTVNSK
jgi:hypothetical protein